MSLLTPPRGGRPGVGNAERAERAERGPSAREAFAVAPSVAHILKARRGLRIDASTDHRCLRAAARFEPGEMILALEGLLSHAPSRYSVQVGAGLHIQPAPGIPEDSLRAAWRYLNHSCRPNALFRGPVLSALTTIEAGEEITFDYNTTEATMAEPFVCRCGHCGGRRIAGYVALPEVERLRLRDVAALYLLDDHLVPAGAGR